MLWVSIIYGLHPSSGIFFCHVNEQSKVELKKILVNVIRSSLSHIKTHLLQLTYDESILVQLKAGDALIDVVENTSLATLKHPVING